MHWPFIDSFEGRLARWDSGYYLKISNNGYEINGTEKAFFPLYPLLISILRELTGISSIWAGLIISAASFATACFLLYQWVRLDYSSDIALGTVVCICIFPMSFFFLAIYAESVFLLTSIASVYFARKGRFIESGIAIALAGATRPPAFLLAIPFVIEFIHQQDFSRSKISKFVIGCIIAPSGLAGYFLFLAIQSGNFNVFELYMSVQNSEWNRSLSWPWITFAHSIQALAFGKNINPDWFSRTIVAQNLFFAFIGLLTLFWSPLKLRYSTTAFLFGSMLFYFSNHGPNGYAFWSFPRHFAAIFPVYLIASIASNRLDKRFQWVLALISFGLLCVYTAWFASGRWVA